MLIEFVFSLFPQSFWGEILNPNLRAPVLYANDNYINVDIIIHEQQWGSSGPVSPKFYTVLYMYRGRPFINVNILCCARTNYKVMLSKNVAV